MAGPGCLGHAVKIALRQNTTLMILFSPDLHSGVKTGILTADFKIRGRLYLDYP